jgi:hypothetical protein
MKREDGLLKLVDFTSKYMSDESLDVDFNKAKKLLGDKNTALNKYVNRILDEVNPNVMKTMAANLGF